MKRIVMSLTLAIVGLIAPGFAFADNEHRGVDECSVATLFGEYLFTGRADAPRYDHDAAEGNPPGPFPRVFAGVYTFDGEGNMTGVASQSRGGVTVSKTSVNATYTLDSGCMGTITFHPQEQHFDIFIALDGSEGNFIRVDQGSIATRTITRQGGASKKH